MEIEYSIFEIITSIAIIANTLLQSSWFIWSYREHHRKHYTDDKQ